MPIFLHLLTLTLTTTPNPVKLSQMPNSFSRLNVTSSARTVILTPAPPTTAPTTGPYDGAETAVTAANPGSSVLVFFRPHLHRDDPSSFLAATAACAARRSTFTSAFGWRYEAGRRVVGSSVKKVGGGAEVLPLAPRGEASSKRPQSSKP
jgi:hypothetical protein